MVCPPSRGFVSPCLPASLRGSCLPLSPIVPLLVSLCLMVSPEVLSPLVSLLVSLCWVVCPPSRGFVVFLAALPACLPSCFPLFEGVSVFPRLSLPLSPFLSHLSCFPLSCVEWCVRLPKGLSTLVSLVSLQVSFFGWCVRLPEVLSPFLSLFVCLCWMVCPPSRGLVSQLVSQVFLPRPCLACLPACLPSCFPLLDGVPAFRRLFHRCLPACLPSCLPACLPALVSQFVSQLVFILVSLCWMACLSSWGLVSQLVSRLSPGLSSSLSSSLSPSLSPSLSRSLSPSLSSSLSPSLFPILSSSLSPSSSSFLFFLFPLVGWCVHLPETLSPLSPSLFPFVSRYPVLRQNYGNRKTINVKRLALLADIITILAAAISRVWPVPQSTFPPTVWGLQWRNFCHAFCLANPTVKLLFLHSGCCFEVVGYGKIWT